MNAIRAYTILDRYVKNTVGCGCAKDLFDRRCGKKDWSITSDSSGVDRQKQHSDAKAAKNRPCEYPVVDERGHPARPQVQRYFETWSSGNQNN